MTPTPTGGSPPPSREGGGSGGAGTEDPSAVPGSDGDAGGPGAASPALPPARSGTVPLPRRVPATREPGAGRRDLHAAPDEETLTRLLAALRGL